VGNTDADEVARAIIEVAVWEGTRAGHEAERFLRMGRDMIPRVKLVLDHCAHALDVFEDFASNVYAERE
jgi:urease gamma subunit